MWWAKFLVGRAKVLWARVLVGIGHYVIADPKVANNIFIENSLNAIVLNLQLIYSLWKLLKSQKVASTHLAIRIDAQVTHHVVAMEKVAK